MTNTSSPPKKRAANIRTDKLRTFEGHPFQVLDDEDMNAISALDMGKSHIVDHNSVQFINMLHSLKIHD